MIKRCNLDINEQGHLTIGGVDCIELVKKYNTPLYVMDEEVIRNNCNKYKDAINRYYKGKGNVCYASKAFSTKEIYRIMKDEKMKVDCVSKGEIFTALSVDFKSEDIYFHGNNKSIDELKYAIENKVGQIVVDNINELDKISKIAKEKNITQKVIIRLKPGIEAHTHEFIRTGQEDSKFGFSINNEEAIKAVYEAIKLDNIKLKGIHCHIGSQIFETKPFKEAASVMMDFIIKVKNDYNYEIEELDIGGGFGIKYTNEDNPLETDEYIKIISQEVLKRAEDNKITPPYITIEPGRSIVGQAGITLYSVGTRKEIKGIRTYLSVDGGMTDNPRYALYKSKYDAIVANKADEKEDDLVTIAGKCCESGDIIAKDIKIAKANEGDVLGVLDTGAYNYSMSSNYNRLLKPAVVMVKDKEDRLIVKRQTLEELIMNDI